MKEHDNAFPSPPPPFRNASRAAVRIALLDLVRKPTTRAVMNSEKTLRIVTGLGNNSEGGEAVIKVCYARGCLCCIL